MKTYFEKLCDNLQEEKHRWVVTGCAGFIGSHLIDTLLRLGQEVTGLDNFATGYRHNLDLVRASVGEERWRRFTFIEGDIAHIDTARRALEGAEFVLHQAALGSVPRSIVDPIASHRANVDGFIVMLDTARMLQIKRFVYASSSSVYGDSQDSPKVEGRQGRLLSPYAATKAINEVYAAVWGTAYGLQCIGLRYFNVFGSRQDPNGAYAAVVPKWVSSALSGTACVINGDGKHSRDFCHVSNVVQANLLAATGPERASGQVFNIAVGEQTSLLDLHDWIWDAAIKTGRVSERVPATFGDFRKGDIRHSLADITKVRELLGYEPTVRVRQGIEELVTSWSGR